MTASFKELLRTRGERPAVAALELRGNGIAVIKQGCDARPEGLIPLNWDRVSVLLSPNGTLFYNVSHPRIGFGVTFHQDGVIHIRNLTVDGGYLGMTPIAVAQDVVGLAIAHSNMVPCSSARVRRWRRC